VAVVEQADLRVQLLVTAELEEQHPAFLVVAVVLLIMGVGKVELVLIMVELVVLGLPMVALILELEVVRVILEVVQALLVVLEEQEQADY
jgi:hypothetical protein